MTTDIIYADVAPIDHGRGGISWGAVIGGALATIAMSIVLVALASGLGLTSFSVHGGNASGTTYAISTALALIVIQWLSAALGGYIAGRTRARWSGLHTHESGFRDTVHGFLAWALATLLTVGVLAMAGAGALGNAAHGVAMLGAGAAGGAGMAAHEAGMPARPGGGDPMALFSDRLFRSEGPAPAAAATTGTTTGTTVTGPIPTTVTINATPEMRAEAGRLLMTRFIDGKVADADQAYLVAQVARVTGLSAEESQKRVADVESAIDEAAAKAKAAAEQARKAAAAGAFFTAFSLMIGAFIGAVAGAIGGHRREMNAAVVLK